MTIIKEKPPTIETNRLLEYWNQEIITEAAKAALKRWKKLAFVLSPQSMMPTIPDAEESCKSWEWATNILIKSNGAERS